MYFATQSKYNAKYGITSIVPSYSYTYFGCPKWPRYACSCTLSFCVNVNKL